MIKLAFTRVAEALEGFSQMAVEKPFQAKGHEADDLVREIVRIMEAEKVELLDGFYVPDHYTIHVSSPLYGRYQNYIGERLCEQIAAEVHRQVERWDYRIQRPVQVHLADGAHESPDQIEIECDFYDISSEGHAAYRVITSDEPMEHFRQAQRLQRAQRFEAAIKEYRAALEIDPKMQACYFNLGAIYFRQCRYQESVWSYAQGLAVRRKHVAALADIAKAYEMLGEWDEAITHLEAAAALKPDHPVVRRRLARVREERELYGMLRTQTKDAFINPRARTNTEQVPLQHFSLYCATSFPQNKRLPLEHMLECIYSELGGVFQTYPERRIEVHIQPARSSSVGRLPSWAGALYDGRIRLVWDASRTIELATAYVLLRHEFTHVLVDQISRGHCPAWLSEGLAEYHARKLMASEQQLLRRAVHQSRTIPFEQLERGFHKLPSDQIRLAYVQSCSMVDYLIKRSGLPEIIKALRRAGSRRDWPDVLKETWQATPYSLEKQWLDSVRRQRP